MGGWGPADWQAEGRAGEGGSAEMFATPTPDPAHVICSLVPSPYKSQAHDVQQTQDKKV